MARFRLATQIRQVGRFALAQPCQLPRSRPSALHPLSQELEPPANPGAVRPAIMPKVLACGERIPHLLQQPPTTPNGITSTHRSHSSNAPAWAVIRWATEANFTQWEQFHLWCRKYT